MCDVGVSNTQSNFYENLMGSKPVHMPLDLFRRIVDEAAAHFPKVKIGYAFTEPLIYVHLEESLRYAKEKKLFTSLTTNALGLKRWAGVMDTEGLDELNISLDGPADVHNHIRGNEHSFAKAMEGVEALALRNSKIQMNVYCVITEWNVGRLMEFLNDLNRYPLKRVGLMHSNFTTQQMADQHNRVFGGLYPATASNTTHTDLGTLDTHGLWSEILEIKCKRWNFPVEFFPDLLSEENLSMYYLRPGQFVGKRCLDIFSNLMIKSNGDVIPAHGRCYNLKVGNLYEENLRQIWNSQTIARFRKTVTAEGGLLPACSRCCSSFVK
jgi:radical SAM protein with 4Fe4S-binding SPASM domain